MASPPGAKPTSFNSLDTSLHTHEPRDQVESPSVSNSNALARFEFEAGRGKDGTKVLMVEWEEDETTSEVEGDWQISWEGKTTVLPAKDNPVAAPGETPVKRLYFLLGQNVAVPSAIRLQKASIVWKTNPLPAIFPPELGATARQAGKKGVLHTIWAKKRLQVLQREIDAESRDNVEGVGLEMARAEKAWIEQNFGVQSRPTALSMSSSSSSSIVNTSANNGNSGTCGYPTSPTSPRSPGGGRLMDKLKGLRIGTGTQDLATSTSASETESGQNDTFHNPLSPETSDIAVGSFGSFAALKGLPPTSSLAAKAAQNPSGPRTFVQLPPDSLAARQHSSVTNGMGGGMASLNALASSTTSSTGLASGPTSNDTSATFRPSASPLIGSDDDDDDLFALPMSPRSPEMAQSPFSFTAQDTKRYLQGANEM